MASSTFRWVVVLFFLFLFLFICFFVSVPIYAKQLSPIGGGGPDDAGGIDPNPNTDGSNGGDNPPTQRGGLNEDVPPGDSDALRGFVWLRGTGGRVSAESEHCVPTPESLGQPGWGARCDCNADGTAPSLLMHLAFPLPSTGVSAAGTSAAAATASVDGRSPPPDMPQERRVVQAKCISGCDSATATVIEDGERRERHDRHGGGGDGGVPSDDGPTRIRRRALVGGATAVRIDVVGAAGCRRLADRPGDDSRKAIFVFDVAVLDSTEMRHKARMCFASIGDWGSPKPPMLRVAEQLDREVEANVAIRFVVSTGDNFYPAGVRSVQDAQFQSTFERPFGSPRLRGMRWVMSVGNHDQWGVKYQVKYSRSHPRYYLPRTIYGLQVPSTPWSNVSLFVLDPFSRFPAPAQATLMQQFFESAEKDTGDRRGDATRRSLGREYQWRVIISHAPLHSGGDHGRTPEIARTRERYTAPVRRSMAHMHISGHDHVLEVHRANGTDFFVSGGGGGAPQYRSELQPTTRFWVGKPNTVATPGFMVHCLGRRKAVTDVVSVDGVRMFSYVTSVKFDAASAGDTLAKPQK